uniref:Uncharacterized protein n=1 Tax=Pyricularia oryzae (strain P131) TaxID=1143193 RepID=L7J3N0_PYRO1
MVRAVVRQRFNQFALKEDNRTYAANCILLERSSAPIKRRQLAEYYINYRPRWLGLTFASSP